MAADPTRAAARQRRVDPYVSAPTYNSIGAWKRLAQEAAAMGAKSAIEIVGLEFDWLASDADGHVALFSTAGGGYAPAEFLRDTDKHDTAIHAILASHASTTARFAPALPPGFENTWRLVAERGLFAFDSDLHGGPYRLVAAPDAPARAADLPARAAEVVGLLRFGHLRFANLSVVSKDLLQQRR
jgi:hypothetical protein